MQPLIMLRTRLQRSIYPPCSRANVRHLSSIHRPRICPLLIIAYLLRLPVRPVRALDGRLAELLWRAAREIQVHECGFEQVVLDLVFVGDGSDDVGADEAFVVEGFEAAPDAGVFVFGEFGLGGGGG